MSILYRSKRIGKNGKEFTMYKLRTLKEGVDKTNSFASVEQYTRLGWIMRKTKFDELPQIWNLIKRDINVVGPRPEEAKTIDVIPEETKRLLLSVRPGLTSLSSIHFFEEGQILENAKDPYKIYWTTIKPLKITLDVFYIQNRDTLLDIWIVFKTFILVIKSLLK